MADTVRVRIMVVIDHTKKWSAFGASYYNDHVEDAREELDVHTLAPSATYHMIEADVPLPEAGPAIIGTVTPDQNPHE